jgi:hypothetical protein
VEEVFYDTLCYANSDTTYSDASWRLWRRHKRTHAKPQNDNALFHSLVSIGHTHFVICYFPKYNYNIYLLFVNGQHVFVSL